MKRLRLVFLVLFYCVVLVGSGAGGDGAWKFIITGDSRSGGESNGVNVAILGEIAAEIVSHNAEFVLLPGDLVSGYVGQDALEIELLTWRDTMQPVYEAGIGVYPVRGNHDLGKPAGRSAWGNVFSGEYSLPQNGPAGEVGLTYSVSHKNVFVLGLDQYVNWLRVNQSWVGGQLAANEKPHVFAFGHVPAFKVHHTSCLDNYAAERDAFWGSLKDAGCRVYACGHDHFYDHAVVDDGDGDGDNDIHQYVVGTAGAPLRDWSPPYDGSNSGMRVEQRLNRKRYGYLLVEVLDDENLCVTWYERDPADGKYAAVAGSADLDGDGMVSIGELGRYAEQWLMGDLAYLDRFCY